MLKPDVQPQMNEFPIFLTDTSCIRLEVKLDSDSDVTQEQMDIAIKFGVDLSNLSAPVDEEKYVLTFIHKLLLQREKIDRGQLTGYLQSGIATLWQEVLSALENSNRKLVDVQSGSLTFSLFCPTISSAQELRDESWIKILTQKMEQLLHKIGK